MSADVFGTLSLSVLPAVSADVVGTLSLSALPAVSADVVGTLSLSALPAVSADVVGTLSLSAQPAESATIDVNPEEGDEGLCEKSLNVKLHVVGSSSSSARPWLQRSRWAIATAMAAVCHPLLPPLPTLMSAVQ